MQRQWVQVMSPAFSWWTTQVLKTRQRIIAAVNMRYHKMTHEFWIKVSKTVEETLALDKENGNDLWWKAIQKEMSAVKVAFKILEDDDKPPIASQYMKCHMVFSIKMEDFSRKACLVAGGHMVEAPKSYDICKCGLKTISQNCPDFGCIK